MSKLIEITLSNYNKMSINKSTCNDEVLEYIKNDLNYREDTKYIHINDNNIGYILYQLSLFTEIHLI